MDINLKAAINKVIVENSPLQYLQSYEADDWFHNIENDKRIFPLCLTSLQNYNYENTTQVATYNNRLIIADKSKLNETADFYENKISLLSNYWLQILNNLLDKSICENVLNVQSIRISKQHQDNSFDITLTFIIVEFQLLLIQSSEVFN
jgi:hypothetical protein